MTTRWHKSTCPFCGLGCGLKVGTDHGRIVAVRGMKGHPVNDGDICKLPANYPPIFYHQDRLKHPHDSTRWGTCACFLVNGCISCCKPLSACN